MSLRIAAGRLQKSAQGAVVPRFASWALAVGALCLGVAVGVVAALAVVGRRGAEEVGVPTASEYGRHGDMEPWHLNDDAVARDLRARVRVLCWVLTSPGNHATKARAVNATWAQRCNKFLFVSSAPDADLPVTVVAVPEGRDHLWGKTKAALAHVHAQHRADADWFLKADDDTFVVVENLRYMLSAHDPRAPRYFGFRLTAANGTYASGGAGYVLSGGALDLVVARGLPDPAACRAGDGGDEDTELGLEVNVIDVVRFLSQGACLRRIGIQLGDSRDSFGRDRFFPMVPERHLISSTIPSDSWFWTMTGYQRTRTGLACCSDTAISFHYVPPGTMFVLDYLLYHLRPFGIDHRPANASTAGPSA